MSPSSRFGSLCRLESLCRWESLCRFGARLGPYLMIEILLPGGTLFALLLYLSRRRFALLPAIKARFTGLMTGHARTAPSHP